MYSAELCTVKENIFYVVAVNVPKFCDVINRDFMDQRPVVVHQKLELIQGQGLV